MASLTLSFHFLACGSKSLLIPAVSEYVFERRRQVNNQSVEGSSRSELSQILKEAGDKFTMVIVRKLENERRSNAQGTLRTTPQVKVPNSQTSTHYENYFDIFSDIYFERNTSKCFLMCNYLKFKIKQN